MTGGGGKGSGGGLNAPAAPTPNPEEMLDEFFEYTSSKQAREWAYKHFGGKSGYPENVASAIVTYSSYRYRDINETLRVTGGDLSKLDDPDFELKDKYGNPLNKLEMKSLIERIDQGMELVEPSPQATTSRRGTSMREFQSLGLTADSDLSAYVGKTYKVNSYISTSLDRKAAFSDKKVQITINVPKGTKGVFMAGDANYKDTLSELPHEEEWLLPHGTKFRIGSAKLVNGKWIVEVEVVT